MEISIWRKTTSQNPNADISNSIAPCFASCLAAFMSEPRPVFFTAGDSGGAGVRVAGDSTSSLSGLSSGEGARVGSSDEGRSMSMTMVEPRRPSRKKDDGRR